ncbi:MAG TPA: DUF362 domain-containing protein [Cyclobacteriaceae bacterium]|nr:DUF362 domain-containing protein [Cyclobacteriaceae bacterium]
MTSLNRRDFLKASVLGGVAISLPENRKWTWPANPSNNSDPARVAITTGDHRARMVFDALKPFSGQIKKAIGNKRILIKPNNVSIDRQLAATHVDTIEGILEFLKSIGKTENVIIAESAAGGATFNGFENFGYFGLEKKYKVKFVDLDQEKNEVVRVFDEKDFRPHAVRTSSLMLDPDTYLISSARMKTHDRVLATLSLKNIVFGSFIKDPGFGWGPNRKEGTRNDKPIAHGSGYRAINYNLFTLARILHPHLAVIDGFDGMEGNGPGNGTPVDHRICVASTDWLAADRVGIELMGIDFANVGYLNYCTEAGLGVGDMNKIEIVGEQLQSHIRPYKLSDNLEKQLIWKQPVG